jgi:hypothetical protein
LYVVTPLAVGRCLAGQACNLLGIKRRCEAGEHSRTQSSNDIVRSAVVSKNDTLDPGSDGTHFFKQRQIFLNGAVGTRNNDTERLHAQSLKSIGMPGRVLHWEIGGGERFADLSAHGLTSNNEDSAHGLLSRQ